MHSHIDCICLTFLHCVLSNVSSNCLPVRMQRRIGCICLTFLHHVCSTLFQNLLPVRMNFSRILLTWWHCQSFSLHLYPLNQSNNIPFVFPLPICFVVLRPNGCLKLSKIYDQLLVSNYHKFHGKLSLYRLVSMRLAGHSHFSSLSFLTRVVVLAQVMVITHIMVSTLCLCNSQTE